MKFYHNPTVEIMLLQQNDIVRTSGGAEENVFLSVFDGRVNGINQKIDNASDFS